MTTQKPKLMETTNIRKTKPNEIKTWFRSFLRHPARKQIGTILQLLGLHGASLAQELDLGLKL